MAKYDVFEVIHEFVNYDDLYDVGSQEDDPLTLLLRDEDDEELTIPSVRQSITFQLGEQQ